MKCLDRGDARTGDLVTPLSRISQDDHEPIFHPGECLVVTRVEGDVILTVEDENGKAGSWASSVFRFAEEKPQEQRLREAVLDLLGALSPLKVIGQPITSLDYKLAKAVERAVMLVGTDATGVPDDR